MSKTELWRAFASEIIAIKAGTKRPLTSGWSTWHGTFEDMERWERHGHGFGMLGRRHPAIDIDVTLPGLADFCERLAVETFGSAPVRARAGSAKRLLMYRTDETLRKRRVEFTAPDGSAQAVELLATGQQYVIEGVHPDGSRYDWLGRPHPDSLATITAELWDCYCETLGRRLYALDCTVTKDGRGGANRTGVVARARDDLLAPDPEHDPMRAMEHWAEAWRTNDMRELPHDRFVDLCAAFRGSAGNFADELFDQFRECLPAPRDTEPNTEKTFQSFDAGVRLGWSRLCQITGYVEPDVFDDMPTTGAEAEAMATPDPIKKDVKDKLGDLIELVDVENAAPDKEEFVEGILTEGTVSVLYGPSNIGKSFAALDLGLHVALGRPWHGRGVKQGRVVYIAGEGLPGLKHRLRAFGVKRGHAGANFAVHSKMPNWREPKEVAAFAELMIARGAPKMTIVDTVLRALHGGDENSSKDMGDLYANVEWYARTTGSHVMLIHHSGKDASKGARGHSGLQGNIDTELRALKDTEEGPITLAMPKQRDGAKADVLTYRLEFVRLGTNQWGKDFGSCVVEKTERPPAAKLKDDAQVNLSVLTELVESNKNVPLDTWRRAVDLRLVASGYKNKETRRQKFNRGLKELTAAEMIEIKSGGVRLKAGIWDD